MMWYDPAGSTAWDFTPRIPGRIDTSTLFSSSTQRRRRGVRKMWMWNVNTHTNPYAMNCCANVLAFFLLSCLCVFSEHHSSVTCVGTHCLVSACCCRTCRTRKNQSNFERPCHITTEQQQPHRQRQCRRRRGFHSCVGFGVPNAPMDASTDCGNDDVDVVVTEGHKSNGSISVYPACTQTHMRI